MPWLRMSNWLNPVLRLSLSLIWTRWSVFLTTSTLLNTGAIKSSFLDGDIIQAMEVGWMEVSSSLDTKKTRHQWEKWSKRPIVWSAARKRCSQLEINGTIIWTMRVAMNKANLTENLTEMAPSTGNRTDCPKVGRQKELQLNISYVDQTMCWLCCFSQNTMSLLSQDEIKLNLFSINYRQYQRYWNGMDMNVSQKSCIWSISTSAQES